MAKNVVIRPSVREQYQKFMARGRVLFFTAPCGFGKSTLAETLLAGQQVLSLTAGEPDFALPADDKDWQVLLIDDLRQMTEEPDQQALYQLIREYSDRRFVLLSRGAVPGWLMAFQYAGLMAVLDADALLFDREDIRSLFRQQGTPVSESELSEILRETSGYPLGVAVIAHCMVGGRPYGPELIAQGYVAGRPALGITCTAVAAQTSAFYDIPAGIYIKSVEPNSDAARQGLREGDIIVAIEGETVTTLDALNTVKNRFRAGDSVSLTIWRDGETFQTGVTLIDRAQ